MVRCDFDVQRLPWGVRDRHHVTIHRLVHVNAIRCVAVVVAHVVVVVRTVQAVEVVHKSFPSLYYFRIVVLDLVIALLSCFIVMLSAVR